MSRRAIKLNLLEALCSTFFSRICEVITVIIQGLDERNEAEGSVLHQTSTLNCYLLQSFYKVLLDTLLS